MEAWQYETAADLDQTLLQRLRHFPREPDMLVYTLRVIGAGLVRLWLRLYHRLEIVGRGNLPTSGPFILVANHASHLDAVCLTAALPMRRLHRVFPAAAQDYFFVSVPRVLLSAVVVNALPFDRETHCRQSLALCRELLATSGGILVLFPEGTRTTTGEMGPFKPGIGLLLAGSPWPVLPCHLDGAFAAWPKGQRLPRPRKLRLVIGRPRFFSDVKRSSETITAIAEQLRRDVAALAAPRGDGHERSDMP